MRFWDASAIVPLLVAEEWTGRLQALAAKDSAMLDGAALPVSVHTGDVISTILKIAAEQKVNLIAMPTAGHHGFLDALRGSTTERVVRHAPCPVLAVPAHVNTGIAR